MYKAEQEKILADLFYDDGWLKSLNDILDNCISNALQIVLAETYRTTAIAYSIGKPMITESGKSISTYVELSVKFDSATLKAYMQSDKQLSSEEWLSVKDGLAATCVVLHIEPFYSDSMPDTLLERMSAVKTLQKVDDKNWEKEILDR